MFAKDWRDKIIGILLVFAGALAGLLWASQHRVDEETKGQVERVSKRQDLQLERLSSLESRLAAGEQKVINNDLELTNLRNALTGRLVEALETIGDCYKETAN